MASSPVRDLFKDYADVATRHERARVLKTLLKEGRRYKNMAAFLEHIDNLLDEALSAKDSEPPKAE